MDINRVNINEQLEGTDEIYFGNVRSDSMATLCVYADIIDLEFVTETLGHKPTKARRKGERNPNKPRQVPAPIGQWFLEAPDTLPFNEQIQFLLDATTSDLTVWDQFSQTYELQMRGVIFLKAWNDGFVLPRSVNEQLVLRHWEFSLSMYSAEGDQILAAFLNKG